MTDYRIEDRHGVLPAAGHRAAEAAHPAPRPRRSPLLRGADGGGGLLLRLLAALPPRRAVGDRRLARSGSCPTRPARPTTRSSRGTSSCTRSFEDGATRRRRSGPAAGARQQRRPDHLRRHRHRPVAATTATRSATSASTSSPAAAPSRPSSGCCPTAPATTCWSRGRPTTAGCRPSRAGSTPIEANSHIAPPKRYLSRYGQLLEHAPYCERDLHGPTEPLARSRAPTSRCWSSTASATCPAASAAAG